MSADYILTVGDARQLSEVLNGKHLKGHAQPRIALIGRSNVGKSSLINTLIGTDLAQVSKQPGKTRKIHFYLWKEGARIVADLPGYGFAKTSHDDRDEWAKFINAYLRRDENLERAVVLLDARHGPTELDCDAIRFLSFESIPVSFVFSKADTLKTQSERVHRRREAMAALKDLGYDPELAHWVSSRTGDGVKDLARDLSGKARPKAR